VISLGRGKVRFCCWLNGGLLARGVNEGHYFGFRSRRERGREGSMWGFLLADRPPCSMLDVGFELSRNTRWTESSSERRGEERRGKERKFHVTWALGRITQVN
jgi:hypothetical protein